MAQGLAEYQLTLEEAVALSVAQGWLLRQDLDAEKAGEGISRKQEVRNDHRTELLARLLPLADPAPVQRWSESMLTGEGWVGRFAAALRDTPESSRPIRLESTGTALSLLSNADGRSRDLLLLIELYAFQPWPERLAWNKKARSRALQRVAEWLPRVGQSDLEAVAREFDRAIKELSRAGRRWGRVAAVAGLGLGLGILTAGLAAPLIGGLIGGVMGLSGAAATSAGLAAIGGGSIAAGGAGMAGGTALLAGLGGAAGVGIGGVAGGFSRLSGGQIVMETVKLRVFTRLVIIEEQHDDAKRRLVVQGLQERLRQVVERFESLEDEIARLKAENAVLREEREAERDDLGLARMTMEQALEDLCEPRAALT